MGSPGDDSCGVVGVSGTFGWPPEPLQAFAASSTAAALAFATASAMAASVAQVLFFRLKHQHYEKIHLASMALILLLGGATLFFHNPWFIKWKPTGIYWLSALIFLGSNHIGTKPVIQRMMEGNVSLPAKIWRRLNYAWAVYFLIMGALNLYVAYSFTTDLWVNFKLFGGMGCMLLFVFIQALYLAKHAVIPSSSRT